MLEQPEEKLDYAGRTRFDRAVDYYSDLLLSKIQDDPINFAENWLEYDLDESDEMENHIKNWAIAAQKSIDFAMTEFPDYHKLFFFHFNRYLQWYAEIHYGAYEEDVD